ncbi:hypothetical protein BNJ_00145 [Kaumoebavirus]|uniref:hypothetical protein n=1 Tax=Kaumoebavirus TaxID=1859492 RepID=UPI0009C1F0B5|nr:hypothetical protein BNJ_00145 [Kaumoebavirus]ARA71977.1 hypothetical protein BNJ_00145 [Kaumoebavirus]
MLSKREAKEMLERLEELPGVTLEESCWKKRGDPSEHMSVHFNGDFIGDYDIIHGEFVCSIPKRNFSDSVRLISLDAKYRVKCFIEEISSVVYERADKYDKLVERLENLREVIPSRFQDDDPEKFLKRVREYVLCLQFAREDTAE